MKFTLSQAAKEAGVSKGTLSRALNSGKVSAERREDGSYQIDASELFRVFQRTPRETRAGTNPQPPGPPANPSADGAAAATETAVLRTKLEAAEARIADMERERQKTDATVEDLRRRLDNADEERRALQRQLAPPAAPERPQEAETVVADLRKRLEETEALITVLTAPEKPQSGRDGTPRGVEPSKGPWGLLARLWGR